MRQSWACSPRIWRGACQSRGPPHFASRPISAVESGRHKQRYVSRGRTFGQELNQTWTATGSRARNPTAVAPNPQAIQAPSGARVHLGPGQVVQGDLIQIDPLVAHRLEPVAGVALHFLEPAATTDPAFAEGLEVFRMPWTSWWWRAPHRTVLGALVARRRGHQDAAKRDPCPEPGPDRRPAWRWRIAAAGHRLGEWAVSVSVPPPLHYGRGR